MNGRRAASATRVMANGRLSEIDAPAKSQFDAPMAETLRQSCDPAEFLLELARQFQPACVLAAAADLDLFDALQGRPRTAGELAQEHGWDSRGLGNLLDALAALGLVTKVDERHSVKSELIPFLVSNSPDSVLPMLQHQANCLRRWAQLATAVQTGSPVHVEPSVRGPERDHAAFIGAMDAISRRSADALVHSLQPLPFAHLLDVGGASGTWTAAFLRAAPAARATLFDLSPVIPHAERALTQAGLRSRVNLVAGDFLADPLPTGADLAWVSAIIHQNSTAQNRQLYANVFAALAPGGRVAIRDIVMEEDRTQPVAGALFALNMLVATEGGGTFTLPEIRADLESVGFGEVTLARRDPGMNSVVIARKPAA